MAMTRHEKHMIDERVQQESDGILAKNFRMAMLLLAVLLVVKAACLLAGLPWYALLPEAAGLLTGGVICMAWMSLRGLWGPADERIASERAKCLSTAWTAAHCAALLVSTALLLLDRDRSMLYVLTMLAMTLILYMTIGRMTRSGLYSGQRGSIWMRLMPVMAAVLIIAPVMMALLSRLRQQTYSVWVYVALEGILLASCLLGGVLAQAMTKRSERRAQERLEQAEDMDEE